MDRIVERTVNGRPTRVLVIEDCRVDFEAVRAVLSPTMTVDHAITLGEGINHAHRVRPDCVLLDLGLPDSDGPETLTSLLAAHPELAVVVLTGRDDDGLGSALVQAGAQDYLPKRLVRPSMLGRTIRHAIERSRIHQALVDARAQLVRAQRLDAFGQLASGMAHDFNNLLAVISTTAGLAVERSHEDASLSEDLSDILAATERGRRLVSQLLTFARRRPGRPERVAVGRQVRALRRILDRTLGAEVELTVHASGAGPHVLIDPGLLDQVLLNLVVNARDAMPSGGRIDICATEGGSGLVCLRVSDTGVGMSEEQARRAIEPFYTTKATGNGLGLSMCYGIVEQAGGRLELHSTLGVGTTVSICLPEVEAAADVVKAPERRRRTRVEGLRVVLVEDMPSLRRVLRRVLRRAGVVVEEAGDGKAALELIRAKPHLDLVVSDVSLPMLTGPEIAEALIDLAPGLPVLLMSGGGRPPGERLPDNVVDVLEKPFQPDTLLAAIDHAVAQARVAGGAAE